MREKGREGGKGVVLRGPRCVSDQPPFPQRIGSILFEAGGAHGDLRRFRVGEHRWLSGGYREPFAIWWTYRYVRRCPPGGNGDGMRASTHRIPASDV